jgi:ATP-dependent helicase Lhr and Lhr-like helicase
MDELATRGLRVLDELQRREARLLSWGMVDGAFTWDELLAIAESVEPDAGLEIDLEDVIEWLLETALLFSLPEPQGRYRTRVAEGVRLFGRLRQIFPHDPWRNAAELVADFRFATLPRRYPDRYIEARDAIAQFTRDLGCSELQARVAVELLGGEGTERKLADFQVDAAARVLAEVRSERSTASIICAGTGSGKTLAFYLPAFMHIAEQMNEDPKTQCIAIYPRIELLRDQLRTCIKNARSVETLLRERRRRPMSVGALYGSVPKDGRDLEKAWHRAAWPSVRCQGRSARRCPYFDCPECDAPLGWLDDDIRVERERLVCTRCECEIGGDTLRLTRRSMSAHPPDILFATTEMLNRGMASRALWPLLGIGDNVVAPALVLLDEVHTYGGIAGAQAALTLRRWRHLAQATAHFVGLSATLAEAPRFMAQLVGLYPNHVAAIEPRRFVTEGCEHIIALRGKPGTATLSTTIQSSMLLRRLLDAEPPITNGISGKRIFVFTDNLDVTNRLFFQLGDAEGWDQPYKPRRVAAHPPLSSLRSSLNPEASARFRDGQSWDVVERIGHDLGRDGRAIVSRTSSQDAGVESDADTIVATASLEVGFDDPLVGGVVQHQAPKDSAAYVQRKGRAGRSREMRPWTVVVLSDWGQDRLAYRSYESLFSPDVPPRYLPIKNRHVLRMQAALSFMDWLTKRTPQANLWNDLARPGTGDARRRQEAIEETITRLLGDSQLREAFGKHLQFSLGLEEAEEASALLWEPPRSLMFSVWPTLLRRLEQQWVRADGAVENDGRHPMPEYIPRALFEDLNLPEVEIQLERRGARPGVGGDDNEDQSWMPIQQAMREFSPGRVSRRFGVAHARDAHWVAPPPHFIGPLEIESFCSREDADALGAFQYVRDGLVTDVDVFRPYRFRTKVPEHGIHERSNSHPLWHTQIVDDGPGTAIPLPRGAAWRELFTGVRFHSHVSGNPIEMRRFATGADVRIREIGPSAAVHEGVVTYQTTRDGTSRPAALGFSASVDAVVVDMHLPGNVHQILAAEPELLRSVRVALFREALRTAQALDGIANVFQRRDLADVYIALVVILAERAGCSLDQARQQFATGAERRLIDEVLGMLRPRSLPVLDAEDADDDHNDDDVRGLFDREAVRTAVAEAARVLSRDLGPEDEPWLRRAVKASAGGALLGACQRLCPQVDAGDLLVELGAGATVERGIAPDQVWLTEATVGGSGFLEAIQRAFAEDPRRFLHLFEAELEPSDFEDVDHYLRVLLARAVPGTADYDPEIADAFGRVRNAQNFADQTSAFDSMLSTFRDRGIGTSHAVVSAVSLRLLRPGTSVESDRLIVSLVRRREELEQRHGIELDGRVCAAFLAADGRVLNDLRRTFPALTHLDGPAERHALIGGLLWPRGSEVRRQSLAFWSPFEGETHCDRLLLHALVPHGPVTVSAESPTWRDELDAALLQHGRAALVAPLIRPELLREAALALASAPTEADSLLLYPRVRAYKRNVGQAMLVFDMPEASQ